MSTGARTFDPEAEQEVDFGRYLRLLAVRWWLIAAGLILGAIGGQYSSPSAMNRSSRFLKLP